MKTISKKDLLAFLDGLLSINSIPTDSSNNGLQVEGKDKISKIVFGVDGCLELSSYAAKSGADFIFVHHGISWGDELKRITGVNARRLSPLFKNDISFYAAHLPLDSHPTLSHNAIIAKELGIISCQPFAKYAGTSLGLKGEFPRKITPVQLTGMLNKLLKTKTTVFGNTRREIRKVAIIAGSAGSNAIAEAERQGVDCFITGETNHSAFHVIQETGLAVFVAGHYATEKPGVLAVMKEVSLKFGVECEFKDLPTGL